MKKRTISDTNKKPSPPERLLLRLPSELREHIQAQAKRHGRTMTSEIIESLTAAYRFNDLQVKIAEDREHIVLGHVRRAIETTLKSMSLSQKDGQDKDAPERLLDFALTLENYWRTLTTYSATKKEIEQLDFISSELLALHLSVTIDRDCWKLRSVLCELMFQPEERVFSQDVRNSIAFLAQSIRTYLKSAKSTS